VVFCGSVGLGSGFDRTVHVGLGPLDHAQKLTVMWPSGAKQVLTNVEVDRAIAVVEP